MNIFSTLPTDLSEEVFEDIVNSSTCKIERIISYGHNSEKNFFYNQPQNEWVIILEGEAIIEFKNKSEVHLKKGDYLNLEAHVEHRVKWTLPNAKTIWLAVHY